MERLNDSEMGGGPRRKSRFNQSGAFLAEGIQFPFEAIDESVSWPKVDFACFASGAFWDALVRKPKICGDSVWSLSRECIHEAAKGLDKSELYEQLLLLKNQISDTRGAFVVLGWLNIQIEKEVFFGMINLIIDVLFAKRNWALAG